jgi:NAD(P)H dehydrogenase (quinone)
MILVTGATGQLGGAAAQQLLKHLEPNQFAVLARDENKAKFFKEQGVNVRIGDFDDQQSLDIALKGISKVLLIPTIVPHRLQQNKRVIDTALKNGVKHIVYSGISHKNIEATTVKGLMIILKPKTIFVKADLPIPSFAIIFIWIYCHFTEVKRI